MTYKRENEEATTKPTCYAKKQHTVVNARTYLNCCRQQTITYLEHKKAGID